MSEPRHRRLPWLAALAGLSVLFSLPLFSQSLEQRVKELEKKIAQLEQRIVQLERTISEYQKDQARPAAASPNAWKDRANWRLLKKGMSKNDVERLLGTPPQVVPNVNYGDIWFYPDSRGGNVSFDVNGILTSWNEI